MTEKTFEEHLQKSCGGGYLFTDILSNLEPEELLGCFMDFLEEQKGDIISFNKQQLVELIKRLQKDFEE